MSTELSKRKLTLSIVAVIVIAIVVVSVLFIYFSPKYSWNSATRDSDGDGVADEWDPLPHDSSVWATGSGRLAISITNNWSYVVHYVVYVDGVEEARMDSRVFSHQSSLGSATIDVTWLRGPNSMTVDIAIVASAPEHWYPDPISYEGTFTVSNGQVLPISLDVSDFHAD